MMPNSARVLIGTVGFMLAVTFAWAVALLSYAHNLPVPILAPPAIHRELPTIDYTPQIIDGRYIASTIKNVYHLPTCSYVKLMQHGRAYATEADARAAGLEPCSRCLNTSQVSRVSTPPAFPE